MEVEAGCGCGGCGRDEEGRGWAEAVVVVAAGVSMAGEAPLGGQHDGRAPFWHQVMERKHRGEGRRWKELLRDATVVLPRATGAQLARARTGEEKRREGEGEGRGSAASGGGIASARCGWVRRNRKTLERSGLGFTCVRPSRSDRTAEVLVVTWLNHRSALGLNYIERRD